MNNNNNNNKEQQQQQQKIFILVKKPLSSNSNQYLLFTRHCDVTRTTPRSKLIVFVKYHLHKWYDVITHFSAP
jgi:hypothetical protein